MINYDDLREALQGCELQPEQARQLERVLLEHARYRAALEGIVNGPDENMGEMLMTGAHSKIIARAALDGES